MSRRAGPCPCLPGPCYGLDRTENRPDNRAYPLIAEKPMNPPRQDSDQKAAGRRAVDRCAADLTRGLPVLIVGDASGPALLALAAEHADAAATAGLP